MFMRALAQVTTAPTNVMIVVAMIVVDDTLINNDIDTHVVSDRCVTVHQKS